ncbi:MAG TPA: hypothetical protein VN761_11220 [Candidatus Polarisedimenticolia bacterium]|nr:hypothetical protein [Candidatus Polarisedimenticolia bacterium]
MLVQTAGARLYDRFDSGANWTLAQNSGTAAIGSSELTLTSPSGVNSTPTATLNSAQTLTGTRQSILVRSHTASQNHSVFFLYATSGANKLEFKIDDSLSPASVVAGYWIGSTYHWVATSTYTPGADGIYMAYQESSGTTYWQISTDGSTWTTVGQLADPVSTASMTFSVQNKGYSTPPAQSQSVIDCFNYKATGAGYSSIEDKTTSGTGAWSLYREAFLNGNYMCQSPGGTSCDGHITVNDVDSTQHFTDTTIPTPRANDSGYNFEIISTDQPSNNWYDNAYRYQDLTYVDADNWTYTMYFKYTYPQYITQGLEFPINKYTGSYRVQGAVAWYPLRDGTYNGVWKVWGGASGWVSTSQNQSFTPGQWYKVTYTVGLHDNTVYYTSFQAGPANSMTTHTWNHSYAATSSGTGEKISAAMQMDDNTQDTTTAGTQKHLYMADWNIGWQDQKLP